MVWINWAWMFTFLESEEYKAAAEPFIRNDMSQEAKDASLHYMKDLWETYVKGSCKASQYFS